jgi:hypothetical protein
MITTPLTTSDFREERRVGQILIYRHTHAISSVLGMVQLEIETVEPEVSVQPDHLALAEFLLRHFQANEVKVIDHIFRSYKRADQQWLEMLGISSTLTPDDVVSLVSRMRLTVELGVGEEEDYLRFFGSPAWDEEHGLYLAPVGEDWQEEEC